MKEILERVDEKFDGKKNDEDAWMTSLNEKEILEILNETKIPFGIDVAASGFTKEKIIIIKIRNSKEIQKNNLNI